MRTVIPCLLLLLLFNACSPVENDRPNIIFIMSDDHASRAISAYDPGLIQTPNIDRLAENGIRFDHCYCTNAICAPSRAVILTGKYSHMNGVVDNSRPFDGEQQSLPKLLQDAGYRTGIVGKWHLKSTPIGFDHWYILPGQGQYYRPDFISQEERASREGYVTDIITDEGIAFIEGRDPEKPFFLMLHHKAPHRNWQPAIRHLDMYAGVKFPVPENLHDDHHGKSKAATKQEMSISGHMSLDYDLKMSDSLVEKKNLEQEVFFWIGDGNLKQRMSPSDYSRWESYYAERVNEYNSLANEPEAIVEWKYQQYMEDYLSCIHTVDENVGRLLDYLQESGLDENTIVIYTSDQGFFLGEHGWYDKRFMYEESHRMPLLISAPGLEASNDDHMLTNADFAPTILKLAGVEVPGDVQGESFHEILTGDGPDNWRDAVYYHYFEYPAVHQVKRHYGIRTEKFKLIHFYYDVDEWELYDLEKDPGEMINLAEDPAYTEIIETLKEKLYDLQKEYLDIDHQQFLPLSVDTISHMGVGRPYELKYKPSRGNCAQYKTLTDGIAYPEGEAYNIGLDNWCGFQGDDFIFEMDMGEIRAISEISAGFLQYQQRWIFPPKTVEFMTSQNGMEYMSITNALCNELNKDDKIMKRIARAVYPGLETRFIKIKAKNTTLPEWHGRAGKPAWLFVDEVIVN